MNVILEGSGNVQYALLLNRAIILCTLCINALSLRFLLTWQVMNVIAPALLTRFLCNICIDSLRSRLYTLHIFRWSQHRWSHLLIKSLLITPAAFAAWKRVFSDINVTLEQQKLTSQSNGQTPNIYSKIYMFNSLCSTMLQTAQQFEGNIDKAVIYFLPIIFHIRFSCSMHITHHFGSTFRIDWLATV